MKLIIDIPEETYNLLKTSGVDWLGAEHILDAVSKGTPLPKRHVRLIDVERLYDDFESMASKSVYQIDITFTRQSGGYHTSNVKHMWHMFLGCSGLTSLEMNMLNTMNCNGEMLGKL